MKMRMVYIGLVLAVFGVGSWWLWEQNTQVKEFIKHYFNQEQFITLEARYSAEQIIDQHRSELLGDSEHAFEAPVLQFYPYLMMEVKYSLADKKTREGVILWGMEDGEMVLNADTWETTRGFDDLISTGATRGDLRVVNALALNPKSNGMTYEELQKALLVETDLLEEWLQSARQKKLIVQRGNLYQLHFQNPKIVVAPVTKISQWLVTKPDPYAKQVAPRYQEEQILRTAQAAFGNEFTIRNAKTVFLPVYRIPVRNPDGSTRVSEWNALNGRRIYPRYLQGS